ncbi:MAG: orotate phosphoribosyltransferase [Deltaproteobacteria bacterium]|nr:orotate phosphoribosyltransferase [Candidatus Zymogenaceae bacterium]
MNELSGRTIELLVETGALRFGDFTLKSGRKSPYFVNIGDVADGAGFSSLGEILAEKIMSELCVDDYDILFGPAYKGIVLAAATSLSLYSLFGVNLPFAYDRKEKKGHGEGGTFVGAGLDRPDSRVLLLDDVITDGGTKIEAVARIGRETTARVAGMLVVVDRMEKDDSGLLFSARIEEETGVPVYSLTTLADIVDYIEARGPELLGVDEGVFSSMKERLS